MNGSTVEYSFKRNARSKRLRLSVHHDGSVVVTAPKRLGVFFIEQFIAQKSEWILEKIELAKKREVGGGLSCKGTQKEYEQLRDQALYIIQQRVHQLNVSYGFSFGKISIRNQKTRWGSCSKNGNLTFNYRIILLHSDLMDYVIVHELCHLQEFNHSESFWKLVEKVVPDYKEKRKRMRES